MAADAGDSRPESAEDYRGMDCTMENGRLVCGACLNDLDCPTGEACLVDYTKKRSYCAPSNCRSDSDCPSRLQVCVTLNDVNLKGPIRRCVPVGPRKAGEECHPDRSREWNCAPGLLCAQSHCGTPCAPGEPGGCPEGTCLATPEGAGACVPSCRSSGCPPGMQCTHTGKGEQYLCERAGLKSCFDNPCGEGEECLVYRWQGGPTDFACARVCAPFRPDNACPAGQVCGAHEGRSYCFQSCEMDKWGKDCPPAFICGAVDEEQTLHGCVPYSEK